MAIYVLNRNSIITRSHIVDVACNFRHSRPGTPDLSSFLAESARRFQSLIVRLFCADRLGFFHYLYFSGLMPITQGKSAIKHINEAFDDP
jgi:hypothetical protein